MNHSVAYRFLRRQGLGWARFAGRIGVVLWTVGGFAVVERLEPSGWAVVSAIAIYATWEIGAALRSIQPISITQIRPDLMEVSGSTFSLAARDLDRAIASLVERERDRKEQRHG